MTYLLIAVILAIILSPILGMRQSPRQKLITELRQTAKRQGLQVNLSRPADAREGEGRLDTAVYRLPWPIDSRSSGLRRAEEWLLVRDTRRGDKSEWDDWNWLTLPVADELLSAVGQAVTQLKAEFSALEASSDGLSVYWQEQGTAGDVERVALILKQLQQQIRH